MKLPASNTPSNTEPVSLAVSLLNQPFLQYERKPATQKALSGPPTDPTWWIPYRDRALLHTCLWTGWGMNPLLQVSLQQAKDALEDSPLASSLIPEPLWNDCWESLQLWEQAANLLVCTPKHRYCGNHLLFISRKHTDLSRYPGGRVSCRESLWRTFHRIREGLTITEIQEVSASLSEVSGISLPSPPPSRPRVFTPRSMALWLSSQK